MAQRKFAIVILFVICLSFFWSGCNLHLPACGGAALVAPTLSSPADGSTFPASFPSDSVPGAFHVAFDWDYSFSTCVPDAYQVDISTDAAFTDVSLGFGTNNGSDTAGKWQLFPGCYFWRVAAYSATDDLNGPYSAAWRFCIADPRTPTATNPPLASVAGWVYMDENDNNARDPGEGAISGARLTLRSGPCPGAMDVLTVESDVTGRYAIDMLKQATYCLATDPLQQTLDPTEQEFSLVWGEARDDINFRYLPSPLATFTETFTATLTATFTATPEPPRAKALQEINCRLGPSPKYPIFAKFPQGEIAPIDGKNEIQTWWWILLKAGHCWVWGNSVQTLGDISHVPVVKYPPEPTDTSEPGCWVYQKDKSTKCVSPCPAGAKPGGTCTP